MPCTDDERLRRGASAPALAWLTLLALLAGCGSQPPPAPPPPESRPVGPVLTLPAPPTSSPPAAAPRPGAPRHVRLPPAPTARNWDEFQIIAARRLVDTHPHDSYMGVPPEPLLGIPVLEVELHPDGSVRSIKVLREPREAKETIQMAIDAVRRAAPYGDVSRLPRPWRFVEVFLFDDEHRFKPATLDR